MNINNKQTILIVDDTTENIDILSGILKETYKVKVAVNGKKALVIASRNPKPDIILLDIMMPEMDGYEVCERLKLNPITAEIPIIFVTAKNAEEDESKGFDLGAVDYISKPVSPPIVKRRVAIHLALHDQNRELEKKVKQKTKELLDTQLEIVRRLGRAADFKDSQTGLHVIRMSYYSRLIAKAYGGSNNWVELIFHASPMHDIGKIGIPDRILLKQGKLDEEDWKIMRQHPEFGAKIIGHHDSELMKMSRVIALSHHERWDGSGYPQGLKGIEIPLEGRIVAIADVFDALTTERHYKKAWAIDDAVKLIDDEAGKHFDPELIPFFHSVLPEILKIKEEYAENTSNLLD